MISNVEFIFDNKYRLTEVKFHSKKVLKTLLIHSSLIKTPNFYHRAKIFLIVKSIFIKMRLGSFGNFLVLYQTLNIPITQHFIQSNIKRFVMYFCFFLPKFFFQMFIKFLPSFLYFSNSNGIISFFQSWVADEIICRLYNLVSHFGSLGNIWTNLVL